MTLKFTFKNLGAIDRAEVELAPLTLICGKNNTGKTYVAYAIYAFLDQWRNLINGRIDDEHIDKVLQDGIISIDMDEQLKKYWGDIQKELQQNWKDDIHKFLAASEERFKDTELLCDLSIDETWKEKSFEKRFYSEQDHLIISAKKSENSSMIDVIIAHDKKDKISSHHPILLKDLIIQALWEAVLKPYLPNSFMVSTERTGAITFKEELNLNQNKLVKYLSKIDAAGNNKFDPFNILEMLYKKNYPLAVEKNVQFINRLASLENQTGELLKNNPELSKYFEAIAGGYYQTSKEGTTQFTPRGTKLKLSLSEASSSIRSLMLLWYWLKAEADVGHILLIDEPELNLHPENQRALARFLAKLVRLGVYVFITTHSNTIVREFNTLIMMAREDLPHLDKVREKFHYDKDEYLEPKKVILYIANRKPKTKTGKDKKDAISTLECIKPNPKFGLDAYTFDETIIDMRNIQNALRFGVVE